VGSECSPTSLGDDTFDAPRAVHTRVGCRCWRARERGRRRDGVHHCWHLHMMHLRIHRLQSACIQMWIRQRLAPRASSPGRSPAAGALECTARAPVSHPRIISSSHPRLPAHSHLACFPLHLFTIICAPSSPLPAGSSLFTVQRRASGPFLPPLPLAVPRASPRVLVHLHGAGNRLARR
jgi:hypothetical protein